MTNSGLLDESPVCVSLFCTVLYVLLRHLLKSSKTAADSFTLKVHYSNISPCTEGLTTASRCDYKGLRPNIFLWRAGNEMSMCQWERGYVLCSRRVGLSPWSCLRCAFGEARGSGMEDTSWVCSLYQCGSSSKRAVSSSIRICERKQAV